MQYLLSRTRLTKADASTVAFFYHVYSNVPTTVARAKASSNVKAIFINEPEHGFVLCNLYLPDSKNIVMLLLKTFPLALKG